MNDAKMRQRLDELISSLPSGEPDLGQVVRTTSTRRQRRRVGLSVAVLAMLLTLSIPPVQGWAGEALSAVFDTLTGGGTGTAPPPSFTPSPDEEPGWVHYTDPTYGISVEVPVDWVFLSDPLPTMTDPRILFVASSGAIQGDDPCDWLTTLPSDGVVIWLEEWFDVEGHGGVPGEFPEKPTAIALSPDQVFNFDCGHVPDGPPVHLVMFQQSSRFFYGQVAVGVTASTQSIQNAERILTSFSASQIGLQSAAPAKGGE